MKLSGLKYFSFLILAPYIVGMTPADSTYDEYSFGAGGGQYAEQDCSGIHKNSIVDIGIKATHKYESPFRTGINASIYSVNGKLRVMAWPDLAFDKKYFSIGTTGIRLGPEDILYGEFSFLDQVPLCTGKGCFRTGFGMRLADDTRLWIGKNIIPYNRDGWAGQLEFPLTSTQYLFVNGRYGESYNIPEYGFSIGTRIRLP
jgi:hypothetical protein